MSYIISRSFEFDGAPAAGFKLIVGAYLGTAGVQPVAHKALGGGDGVLRGAIEVPESGMVSVEVLTDDPVALTLLDVAGDVVYTEVVGKVNAVNADASAVAYSGAVVVDFFVTPGQISVEEGGTEDFTITEVLADGTTRPSDSPTVTSNAPATATETELNGVVTVTGVAAGSTTVDVEVTLANGEVKTLSVPVTVTAP